MQETHRQQSEDKDVQEDITHGQAAIINFRWLIIVGAMVSSIWTLALPGASVGRQAFVIFFLLVYSVLNFLLLTRYIRRNLSAGLTYGMSLADLILITVVIAIQPNIFESYVYVYYYPALMVLAVAFPVTMTAAYTAGVIAVYGLMSALSPGAELQQIFARLLMVAAVPFCASLYRGIEHDRRSGKAKLVSLGGGGPGSLQ